jgi:hypothetical protein
VPFHSTRGLFTAPMAFEPPPEREGAEGHLPDPLVTFRTAHRVAAADVGNVAPLMAPTEAPMGADVAHREAVRARQRWQLRRHLPRGGGLIGGGGEPVERLRRPRLGARVAAKEVTDGRAGRPGPAGLACPAERHQLLGPPGRRPWPRVPERRHPRVRRVAGRGAGPTGARCEALWAGGEIAVAPFVPRRAADAGACAALGQC